MLISKSKFPDDSRRLVYTTNSEVLPFVPGNRLIVKCYDCSHCLSIYDLINTSVLRVPNPNYCLCLHVTNFHLLISDLINTSVLHVPNSNYCLCLLVTNFEVNVTVCADKLISVTISCFNDKESILFINSGVFSSVILFKKFGQVVG